MKTLVTTKNYKSRKFRRNHRAISFKYASWQLTSHHIEDFGVFIIFLYFLVIIFMLYFMDLINLYFLYLSLLS